MAEGGIWWSLLQKILQIDFFFCSHKVKNKQKSLNSYIWQEGKKKNKIEGVWGSFSFLGNLGYGLKAGSYSNSGQEALKNQEGSSCIALFRKREEKMQERLRMCMIPAGQRSCLSQHLLSEWRRWNHPSCTQCPVSSLYPFLEVQSEVFQPAMVVLNCRVQGFSYASFSDREQ